MNTAIQGLIIIGVGGCLGYFYLSNQLLDKVLFPPRGENAGDNINRAKRKVGFISLGAMGMPMAINIAICPLFLGGE